MSDFTMSRFGRDLLRKKFLRAPFNNREAASQDLIFAAFMCDERKVRLALDDGADSDIKDISGLTPLLLVLSHNDRKKYRGLLSCLTMLLEHGADLNSSDRKGRTACHIVCSNDRIERGDRFAALKMLVNFKPREEGLTRFSNERYEAKLSQTEPSKDCWQSGLVSVGDDGKISEPRLSRPMKAFTINVDVDGDVEGPASLPTWQSGQNLSKDASIYNISLELSRSQSVVRNVTLYSKWKSSLGAHRRSNSAEQDVKLVNQTCNINKPDSGWRTPLLDAAQHGFSEGIRFLIEMKAEVNARTRTGQTPLHRAVWGLHIDCIDALLCAGCDMNAQDNSGNTLLHLLAINAKNRIENAFIDRTLQVIEMVVKLNSETLKERKSYIMTAIRVSLESLGITQDKTVIALITEFTAVEGAELSTKNNQNVSAYGIAARLANKQQCSVKIARALHP